MPWREQDLRGRQCWAPALSTAPRPLEARACSAATAWRELILHPVLACAGWYHHWPSFHMAFGDHFSLWVSCMVPREFGDSIMEKTSTVEVFQSLAIAVEIYCKFTEIFTEVLSFPSRPLKPSMLKLPLQLGQKPSSLAPTGSKFVSSCSAQWKAGLWVPASKPVSGVTPQPRVWCSIFLHHKAPLVTSGAPCSSSLYCILHFDALFQVLNGCESPIAH